MRPDLVRGNLDLLLLVIVGDGAGHGYAIIEALRERSGGELDLPEGTVYPALHRLERAGLLTSSWDESSGRRRRTYRLTAKGRTAAAERKAEFGAFAAIVHRIIDGAPGTGLTAGGGAPWPTPA